MLTLLALHGSGRDETDLMDFCHRLAPGSNIATPRGPFVQADGFTFFKRRSDRSIDVAEVLYLAKRWIALDFAAYVPPSDEVVWSAIPAEQYLPKHCCPLPPTSSQALF